MLIERRRIPSILRGRRQRREFTRTNLNARIDERIVCAGAEAAEEPREIPESLFPIELGSSRVCPVGGVAESKFLQEQAVYGLGARLVRNDIIFEFIIVVTEALLAYH